MYGCSEDEIIKLRVFRFYELLENISLLKINPFQIQRKFNLTHILDYILYYFLINFLRPTKISIHD